MKHVAGTSKKQSSPKTGSARVSPRKKADSARKKRPRRTREQTTTQILDAAEYLFAHHDPCVVTVRQIAERAGVTHALVHQYVGTKDDVLTAVVVRAAPDRTRMIAEEPDVHTVFPRLFDSVLTAKAHSRLVVRSALDGVEYASLNDRITTGQAMLNLLLEAKASGETRLPTPQTIDPRIALAAAVSLVYGWVAVDSWLVQIFDLEDEDPEAVRQQLADVFTYITDLALPPGDQPDSRTE